MSVGSRPPSERYRIGDLVLDCGSREVARGRQQVLLPGLSFDLLLELARAAPNTVTTDELMSRVWGAVVVSPETVSKRVELLRRALNDDSHEPRYIALTRGHGYRLLPKVRLERRRRLIPFFGAAAGLAALVGGAFLWAEFKPQGPLPEKSVAVLPFVSMSGNPEDEYFADGLTEELGHALAGIPALKVTGRTSSFHYKGRNEDLRSIGRTLGVAHVLEGSVRRAGDKLRITTQLLKTADGFNLWSATYDRPGGDILAIQADIARNVVRALHAELLDGDEQLFPAYTSIDPEFFALYLKALQLLNQGELEAVRQAQAMLEQMLQGHPDFGPAWDRLAAVHIQRLMAPDQSYPLSWDQGWQRVKEVVARSLELDTGNGYAHAGLGAIAWLYERDLARGARYFQRALELDPTNLEVIGIVARFAKYIGRLEVAMPLEQYVVGRDPLCLACRYSLTKTYLYARRLQDAEDAIRTYQLLAGGGEYTLGVTLLLQGNPQAALESFGRLDHHEYIRMQGTALALHDLGRKTESGSLIDELRVKWGQHEPWVVAEAYAYLGLPDLAFEWLENAYEQTPLDLATGFQSPLIENIVADPRRHELLKKIDRAPEQLAAVEFEVSVPAVTGTDAG